MTDTLVNRVLELAAKQPDKQAVIFKKEQLTYSRLAERMKIIAVRLKDMGIKKGDRVLFTALSKPEMVAAYLGIQYLGAIAVFVDKNGTADNSADIYEDAQASIFLTDKPMGDYADKCRLYSLKRIYAVDDIDNTDDVELAYAMPDEDDIAELLFTTGTTGKPKGVILTYKSVYNIFINTIEGIGMSGDERLLLPLPLNHSFALRVLRAVLYLGATVVLQNGFAFSKELENNLNEFQCTAMAAVAASMEIIYGQMQDKFSEIVGKFRYIEISAGSLTVEQRKRFVKLLPNTIIYNTWGSSESGGALFINVTECVSDPVKVAAVGKPLPNVEVKVIDTEGNDIKSDSTHPGRMALKGDMKMAGYWRREELTQETLKGDWLITGDMVYLDEDGYVYMLGRADDIINVGGEKVSPVEVENAAGEYEYVKECACIGIPDPAGISGQVPMLFVVAKGSQYSEEDLKAFLAHKLERYKLPAKYLLLSELPRNRMQKVDRKELKNIWERSENGEELLINPVMQAILTRRSIRRFTDKPVPREILDLILKAGYYAPTGHNMQTWKFTVLTSAESIEKLKAVTVETAKANNVYCYGFENPKCLILISNDERNPYGCQDASCAAENIFLAAHSYGIGSVWLNPLMTLRNVEPVKSFLDELKVPANHTVWCMAALGYPSADGVMLAKKKDVVYYADDEHI